MSTHSTFIVRLLPAFVLGCLLATPAQADTFGTGANAFTIDFVEIGNPGNADDAGAGGGIYSSPYGGVSYTYRMGVTEVPQDWITKATNLGMGNVSAGSWTGNQPAANMTWYEAAAFVNWMNTSTGHQPAYDLTYSNGWSMRLWSSAEAWQAGGQNLYRHKDAYYFLPSEDEWYKAAYHKNDGVTANYWDYPTGSNSIPTAITSGTGAGTALFNNTANSPANVDQDGGLSPYGTRGQGGNVFEWVESAFDGLNNDSTEHRVPRGGAWYFGEDAMRPSFRLSNDPRDAGNDFGFRVASNVPDTDGDGIPDIYETGTGIYVSPTNTGTSPTNPDSDGDGLTDGHEVYTYHTNPNLRDTDGDGFDDAFELSTGFDPTSAASAPDLVSTILTAVEYRFTGANGVSYRIEVSTDLANWTTLEAPIIGNGGVITRFYSIEGQTKRFFRSRRN